MDDSISRQAAIDALDEQIRRCDKALSAFDISMKDEYAVKVERASLVAFRETLEYMPSAQTERKNGKWIERNPRNSPDCRLIECSECGNAYIVGYNINYDDWINGRNFCMKCGADLRGGSNDKNT